MKTMKASHVIGLAIMIAVLGLSGCGKKSALTPPQESEYPKQYPRQ